MVHQHGHNNANGQSEFNYGSDVHKGLLLSVKIFSGDISFWLGPVWSYGENEVNLKKFPVLPQKKSVLFLIIEAIQHAQLL